MFDLDKGRIGARLDKFGTDRPWYQQGGCHRDGPEDSDRFMTSMGDEGSGAD